MSHTVRHDKNITCWVLVEDGLTGTLNQCLGVTDALGITPEIKHFQLKEPWKTLSPYLNICISCGYEGADLNEPYPDLLIAAGRKAIGLAQMVKTKSKSKTFTVYLQDPRAKHSGFDLIAAPAHDPANGNNVITTTTAPNRITPSLLDNAKNEWEEKFAHLPTPRVAVLIGGTSKAYTMTAGVAGELGEELKKLAQSGVGLMVTASRRTGVDNLKILGAWLKGTNAYVWDGIGKNPYHGYLALADYIFVTADSVSMASEAVSTGKPVYRIDLVGGSKRLNAFHELLQTKGAIRPYGGKLEKWDYEPFQDAAIVANAIKERMKA